MKSKIIIPFIIGIITLMSTASATVTTLDYNDLVADYNAIDDNMYLIAQMRWNLTDLPSGRIIDSALLCMHIVDKYGSPDNDVNMSRIANQSWDETTSAAELNAMTPSYVDATHVWNSTTNDTLSCVDVTKQLRVDYKAGNTFCSLRFNDVDFPVGTLTEVSDDTGLEVGEVETTSLVFNDRENTAGFGSRPQLIVTSSPGNNVTYQNPSQNVTYLTWSEANNLSVQVRGYTAMDYAWLATNETGTWENRTALYPPRDLGDVADDWITVNYTWSHATYCNRVIGWKIFFNDTAGNENVTSVKSFYILPYINHTSYGMDKLSSISCDAKNNITFIVASGYSGRIDVWMPNITYDSTRECGHSSTAGTQIVCYNETAYCFCRLNHSTTSSATTFKIYSSSCWYDNRYHLHRNERGNYVR